MRAEKGCAEHIYSGKCALVLKNAPVVSTKIVDIKSGWSLYVSAQNLETF